MGSSNNNSSSNMEGGYLLRLLIVHLVIILMELDVQLVLQPSLTRIKLVKHHVFHAQLVA